MEEDDSETTESETDSERSVALAETSPKTVDVKRRKLLIGVPAIGIAAAGCYTLLNSGSNGGDGSAGDPDETETPFGYGGSPTRTGVGQPGDWDGTETATEAPTDTATAAPTDAATATQTGTATATPTDTATATATPTETPGDYGNQTYGEYGYGGVFP